MKVLGIDPGLTRTGIGLLEYKDSVKSVKWKTLNFEEGDLGTRIYNYYKGMKCFLKREKPDVAVIESLFFGKNTKTLIHLGELRGAYILLLKEMKIPIYEYTPREIKIAITGSGNANKEEVKYMVKKLLKVRKEIINDASDALASALCYILRNNDKLHKR